MCFLCVLYTAVYKCLNKYIYLLYVRRVEPIPSWCEEDIVWLIRKHCSAKIGCELTRMCDAMCHRAHNIFWGIGHFYTVLSISRYVYYFSLCMFLCNVMVTPPSLILTQSQQRNLRNWGSLLLSLLLRLLSGWGNSLQKLGSKSNRDRWAGHTSLCYPRGILIFKVKPT